MKIVPVRAERRSALLVVCLRGQPHRPRAGGRPARSASKPQISIWWLCVSNP